MTLPPSEANKDALGHIPRYAIFRGHRVRVIGYEDGLFLILDKDDARFKLRRDRLTFIKTKTKKS